MLKQQKAAAAAAAAAAASASSPAVSSSSKADAAASSSSSPSSSSSSSSDALIPAQHSSSSGDAGKDSSTSLSLAHAERDAALAARGKAEAELVRVSAAWRATQQALDASRAEIEGPIADSKARAEERFRSLEAARRQKLRDSLVRKAEAVSREKGKALAAVVEERQKAEARVSESETRRLSEAVTAASLLAAERRTHAEELARAARASSELRAELKAAAAEAALSADAALAAALDRSAGAAGAAEAAVRSSMAEAIAELGRRHALELVEAAEGAKRETEATLRVEIDFLKGEFAAASARAAAEAMNVATASKVRDSAIEDTVKARNDLAEAQRQLREQRKGASALESARQQSKVVARRAEGLEIENEALASAVEELRGGAAEVVAAARRAAEV